MKKSLIISIFYFCLYGYGAVFNAWDDSKDIENQTISTKVVSKKFSLIIASLSDDKKKYEKFSGTVCVRVEDKNGVLLSDWQELNFSDEYRKEISFIVKKAVGGKNFARVRIEYDFDKNKKCPLTSLEKYKSFLSDSFAVRAYKFEFLLKDKVFVAQKRYLFKEALKALDFEGDVIEDYERTLSLGYKKLNREKKEDDSLAGELKISKALFEKGRADMEFYFDDTAFVKFIARDLTFSDVDKKDTSLKDREIYGEKIVFFRADSFYLSFPSRPFIKNAFKNFTYFSNDLNHSASFCDFSVKIEAKGEEGGILRNYQDPKKLYFANNLEINASLKVSPEKGLILKRSPSSYKSYDLVFKEGIGILRYKNAIFNYERDRSRPKNPLSVNGRDCNISFSIKDEKFESVKGKIFSDFEKKALFVYGRVETEDIKTDLNDTKHKIFIDVYCDKDCGKFFKNFEERSIGWFLNKDDNYTVISDFRPKPSPSLKDTVSPYVGIKNIEKAKEGVVKFSIFNTSLESLSSYIHIDIPSWLWHSPYYDYNYSLSSDCSSHPCFLYLYSPLKKKDFKDIESGNYKGVDLEEFNGSIKNRRLKVFR